MKIINQMNYEDIYINKKDEFIFIETCIDRPNKCSIKFTKYIIPKIVNCIKGETSEYCIDSTENYAGFFMVNDYTFPEISNNRNIAFFQNGVCIILESSIKLKMIEILESFLE